MGWVLGTTALPGDAIHACGEQRILEASGKTTSDIQVDVVRARGGNMSRCFGLGNPLNHHYHHHHLLLRLLQN